MDLPVLLQRVRVLQQQLSNEKQSVNVLSEQLEQAKASFHMTNGRLQEISHLIDEEQKLIEEKALTAKKLADEQQQAVMDSLEGNDGKVIEQDPE